MLSPYPRFVDRKTNAYSSTLILYLRLEICEMYCDHDVRDGNLHLPASSSREQPRRRSSVGKGLYVLWK